MKAATVYKRGNHFYFHSSSKTTAGVWIATQPFIKTDRDASPADLGNYALAAIGGSQTSIPHPIVWSNLLAPLLVQAGIKSWGTFMRTAQCLSLEADQDRLKIIPNRNLGASDGFDEILDKTIDVPLSSSPDHTGMALIKAFTLCQ